MCVIAQQEHLFTKYKWMKEHFRIFFHEKNKLLLTFYDVDFMNEI